MNNNKFSSLLYAVPSSLDGFAGLLDVGDTLTEYNYSDSAEDADFDALASDWYAVGQDLKAAMEEYDSGQSG